jgi:hypothetical protein
MECAIFHGKRVTPTRLVWAVGALAEGLGIRAVVRVFEVDPNTVLQWLVEAADHLNAFSQSSCMTSASHRCRSTNSLPC